MNPLFEKLFDNPTYPFTMATDVGISDKGDVYTAELELAGFSKKEIKLTAIEGVLNVCAENKKRKKKFKVYLTTDVSEEHISSKLENGLLTITLPKKEVCEGREIKIET
jgi:HSP20 family molecular chaperone IbpA